MMDIALPLKIMDAIALLLFLSFWAGYVAFAKKMAKKTRTLSSVLRYHRVGWMRRFSERENRIGDAALLANQQRMVSFFASTTLLILAGVLGALTASDGLAAMLANLPYRESATSAELQLKLLVLALVFIYAFFKFTWSMRQFGFFDVVMGAAPMQEETKSDPKASQNFSHYAAKLNDLAGHDFNHGLRAYYFAMALLAWLLGAFPFMAATILVVFILYRREFHSKALDTLLACKESAPQ